MEAIYEAQIFLFVRGACFRQAGGAAREENVDSRVQVIICLIAEILMITMGG